MKPYDITQPNQPPWRFIQHMIKPYPIKIILLIITAIVSAANVTLFPYFLKNIINILEKIPLHRSQAMQLEQPHIANLFYLWILFEIAMRLQGYIAIHFFADVKKNIHAYLLYYLVNTTYHFFSDTPIGSINKKIDDITLSSERMLNSYINCSTISFLSIALMSFTHIHWHFFMYTFIWASIHLGINSYLYIKVHHYPKHMLNKHRMYWTASDTLHNILNVHYFVIHNTNRHTLVIDKY